MAIAIARELHFPLFQARKHDPVHERKNWSSWIWKAFVRRFWKCRDSSVLSCSLKSQEMRRRVPLPVRLSQNLYFRRRCWKSARIRFTSNRSRGIPPCRVPICGSCAVIMEFTGGVEMGFSWTRFLPGGLSRTPFWRGKGNLLLVVQLGITPEEISNRLIRGIVAGNFVYFFFMLILMFLDTYSLCIFVLCGKCFSCAFC